MQAVIRIAYNFDVVRFAIYQVFGMEGLSCEYLFFIPVFMFDRGFTQAVFGFCYGKDFYVLQNADIRFWRRLSFAVDDADAYKPGKGKHEPVYCDENKVFQKTVRIERDEFCYCQHF